MIKLRLARKFTAVLANLSLLLNTFLPFALVIQPVYAQDPQIIVSTIQYDSSAHKLDITTDTSQKIAYQLFYKTDEKIDAIAGNDLNQANQSESFYLGTCSSNSVCLSQNISRGILKIESNSKFYSKLFTLENNVLTITKEIESLQSDLTPEEDDFLNNIDTQVLGSTVSNWTFEKVELNKTYTAPQNDQVKITFTKLPEISGNIKIEEITLTEDQIKQTGSVSNKAYDITSDMVDGTFAYNLSLPIPESSKDKIVEIKFVEDIYEIDSAQKVDLVTKTDDTVLAKNLDHFTVFFAVVKTTDKNLVEKEIFKKGETVYINTLVLDLSKTRIIIKNSNGDIVKQFNDTYSPAYQYTYKVLQNDPIGEYSINIGSYQIIGGSFWRGYQWDWVWENRVDTFIVESVCGDEFKDTDEECDGGQNGQVCTPEYNSTCDYCSNECKTITIDNFDRIPPEKPTGLKFQSTDRTKNFNCGSFLQLQPVTPDWDDITDDSTFSHYEYTSFLPNGSIGLNQKKLTSSEFPNNWMPPTDGAYGYAVRSVDKAGNTSDWALSSKTLEGSCQITYDSTAPTSSIFVQGDLDESKNIVGNTRWFKSFDNIDLKINAGDQSLDKINYQILNGDTICPNSNLSLYSSVTNGTNIASIINSKADGIYSLCYFASDLAGNNEATIHKEILKKDSIIPSFTISDISGNKIDGVFYNQKDISFKLNVDDPSSGYSHARFDLYNADINHNCTTLIGSNQDNAVSTDNPVTRTLLKTGLSDENYCFRVWVYDRVQNKTWTDSSGNNGWIKFTIDSNPPSIPRLLGSEIFITKGTAFSQKWEPVSDAVLYQYESCHMDPGDHNAVCSNVKYSKTYTGFTKNVDTGQPNSHFWWRVKAKDVAGNWSNWSESKEVIIDNSVPASTISLPENSGPGSIITTKTWNGLVSGTAMDIYLSGIKEVKLSIKNDNTNLYWNGSAWQSDLTLITANGKENWNYQLLDDSLTDGSYTIKSHAIDNAGNQENTYTLTIVLDNTISEVGISLDPTNPDASNGWYKTQPEVTLTHTDANFDKIQYQWDSQSDSGWNTYSDSFKLTTEGAHILYYRAIDKATNISPVGVKNIKWDKTDLEFGPQNISANPNPTSGSTSKISWEKAKDNDGIDHYEIQWNLNDSTNPLSYSKTVDGNTFETEIDKLIEGRWTVKVIAFDASGKSKDNSIDLIVDRTGPSAPNLTLTGTGTGTASLSWNTIPDAKDYIIWYGNTPGTYLYGARVGNITSYTVQGIGAGNYYFVVKAVDAAQNQSGNSNEVNTGTIAGAAGIEPGQPAQGFTPEVLGTNTQNDESLNETSPKIDQSQNTGNILGESTSTCSGNLLPILFLIALFVNILFIRRFSAHWIVLLLITVSTGLFDYIISKNSCSLGQKWLSNYFWIGSILSFLIPLFSSKKQNN